jgi:Flp pilus assembly protein TadG
MTATAEKAPKRWPKTLARLWRDRKGAHAIELAVVAFPLTMLGLGTLEFGRLSWTREALQTIAIQGARCMGVLNTNCASGGGYSSTNTQTYLEGLASNWQMTLTASNLTLSRAATCGGVTTASSFSSVQITYTFTTVIPAIVTALSNGLSLTVSACYPNQS